MNTRLVDFTGKRFGKLIVISRFYHEKKTTKWNCICDCGNLKIINAYSLSKGITKSCGCLISEIAKKQETTHGLSKTPEYKIYMTIKQRCYNEKSKSYKYYGGRGIKMSDSWKNSFEIFYKDIGKRPSTNHSIERKDNNMNYSKDNCKWETKLIQANNCRSNRIIEINGVSLTASEWCRKYNISYSVFMQRINKLKWDVIKALITPKITYN